MGSVYTYNLCHLTDLHVEQVMEVNTRAVLRLLFIERLRHLAQFHKEIRFLNLLVFDQCYARATVVRARF